MKKCEKCGKEVLFPFTCTYCGKDYCDEHRLPENHQCPTFPEDSKFWYRKKRLANVEEKTGVCPNCGSPSSEMTNYDAKTMTFRCKECDHKYTQLKAFPYDYVEYVEPKDKTESQEKPKTRKPFPVKKVIGLFSIIAIVGAFLWYAPTIISTVQNLFSQSSYTKVTVVMGQIAIYDHGDNHYVFGYRLIASDPIDKFYVSSGFQTRVFSATEGATYKDLGIEIKVLEVHSDYIVLLVKPTY